MKIGMIAQEIALTLIAFDTSQPRGVEDALDWIKSWCRKNKLFVRNFAGTKALLIETQPNLKTQLNFVTHLDVVPANNWHKAFSPRLKNNFIIGRGAVDDKGPLGVCLEVLTRAKDDINISCLIVTDEETINTEICTILDSKIFHPIFCLVVDGGTHNCFDIGQKGVLQSTVTIHTKGGHSAFEDRSQSASEQLFLFLKFLQKKSKSLRNDSFFSKTFINISKISTETIPFGLPSLAEAEIQIQFPSPQTSSMWIKILQDSKRRLKNVDIKFGWISEPHIFKDKKILKILESFPKKKLITSGGNNLAKNLCLAGISAVSHCPVEEYNAHCIEEKILTSDLEKGVRFYLQLIKRFKNYC